MIAWKIDDTKNNLDFDEVVLLKWSNINIDIISLSCKLIFCMHIFWKNISLVKCQLRSRKNRKKINWLICTDTLSDSYQDIPHQLLSQIVVSSRIKCTYVHNKYEQYQFFLLIWEELEMFYALSFI